MNDQTAHQQATREAYADAPPRRTDRTPGDYAIPQSPFKSPDALAEAMSKFTGKTWFSSYCHVGGRGQCQYMAASGLAIQIYIWRDASGGWHPERKVGANWLPDLDLLDALVAASRPTKLCKAHASAIMDHSGECTTCATDAAILARWEIRVGMRCEICGKRNEYCTCRIGDDTFD